MHVESRVYVSWVGKKLDDMMGDKISVPDISTEVILNFAVPMEKHTSTGW